MEAGGKSMAESIRPIQELPAELADRIAAGEVIDRPVSIVKELVENSIDAGSDSITVEIRSGGTKYIRVTDNGSGIPSEQTELAFRRHATSKIGSAADLNAIGTLGFRGEALASIAAVSRTELITKTASDPTGSCVVIEGGSTVESGPRGCPTGTTIIVRDLFFNTPARRKFLKSERAESALIIDLMSKIALAFPEIRVRMINNSNTLFSTPGKGDRRRAIATVFDPHSASRLIELRQTSPSGISVEGYLSPPDFTRKNRRSQIFFVNGRYIKSRLIENCITEAYRSRMFEGQHPIVFLFLKIDPALTDVNIHPNKKEIRFDGEAELREFLTGAMSRILKTREAIPEISHSDLTPREQQPEAPKETGGKETLSSEKASGKMEQLDIRQMLRARRAEEESASYRVVPGVDAAHLKANSSASEKPEQRNRQQAEHITRAESEEFLHSASPQAPSPQHSYGGYVPSCEAAEVRPFDVSEIQPIGVIFAEYILGSSGDCFYLIDQHAAHERVFYERFMQSFEQETPSSQILAVPLTVQISSAARSMAEDWIPFLNDAGFLLEEFGNHTYVIREIPEYMDLTEAEHFVRDFSEGAAGKKKIEDRLITRACKSAVKANDRLSMREIEQLIRDLSRCRNPFSCPHGRPTIVRMTHREIDRMFRR